MFWPAPRPPKKMGTKIKRKMRQLFNTPKDTFGPRFSTPPIECVRRKMQKQLRKLCCWAQDLEKQGKTELQTKCGKFPKHNFMLFFLRPQLARCLLLFIGYLLASFQRSFFFLFGFLLSCFHCSKMGDVRWAAWQWPTLKFT